MTYPSCRMDEALLIAVLLTPRFQEAGWYALQYAWKTVLSLQKGDLKWTSPKVKQVEDPIFQGYVTCYGKVVSLHFHSAPSMCLFYTHVGNIFLRVMLGPGMWTNSLYIFQFVLLSPVYMNGSALPRRLHAASGSWAWNFCLDKRHHICRSCMKTGHDGCLWIWGFTISTCWFCPHHSPCLWPLRNYWADSKNVLLTLGTVAFHPMLKITSRPWDFLFWQGLRSSEPVLGHWTSDLL